MEFGCRMIAITIMAEVCVPAKAEGVTNNTNQSLNNSRYHEKNVARDCFIVLLRVQMPPQSTQPSENTQKYICKEL